LVVCKLRALECASRQQSQIRYKSSKNIGKRARVARKNVKPLHNFAESVLKSEKDVKKPLLKEHICEKSCILLWKNNLYDYETIYFTSHHTIRLRRYGDGSNH